MLRTSAFGVCVGHRRCGQQLEGSEGVGQLAHERLCLLGGAWVIEGVRVGFGRCVLR